MIGEARVSEHRGQDDVLTAGLGIAGLRTGTPPAFADAAQPTPEELRRRAFWSSWRGIADLGPGGAYGEVYGSVAHVPGREYGALAWVPGAKHPHRVLAQIPDGFDKQKRCLVVSVASGSRGVHGAIAVGGAWALPRGYAVVHTDKAAGSDYFDAASASGVALDGRRTQDRDAMVFAPEAVGEGGVAFKHAHSQDNPEADWGLHVRQAAEFGLRCLEEAFPHAAPFTFDNTRIIAVGISNGGGAVLRAAEMEDEWLDGVVAGEPNVHVRGSRPLYDYATEAALLMPCALPALGLPALPNAEAQCAALKDAGMLQGEDLAAQQRDAWAKLRAGGWTDEALRAGALSVGFDLWRAIAVAYASAHGRFAHDAHPCGYRYLGMGANQQAQAPDEATRASWWPEASGIPPGAGAGLFEREAAASAFEGLQGLRALWVGEGEHARRVKAGVAETVVNMPRPGLPVIVVHGVDDGLIPIAFSSIPYVRAAQAAGREVRFWQVHGVQHFDAFLALPQYASVYTPLLPYVYEALDRLDAHLDGKARLPPHATLTPKPRKPGGSLQRPDLDLPR